MQGCTEPTIETVRRCMPTIDHVPLAIDQEGRALALPDGAAGWRVRRHTGGRPKLVVGDKKLPMLFPLDYTLADVEDILPPGTYRLDLVDKDGHPLEVTVPITLSGPRNAAPESYEPTPLPGDELIPAVLPPTGSDLRLVLEANVRATQMAFVHTQRTLEMGLRMAETLRQGVQVLAESQSDWIKSIAASRGFYRNAAPPHVEPLALAAPTTRGGDDQEDEGDEEEGNEEEGGAHPPRPDWMEALGLAIAPAIAALVPQAVEAFTAAKSADGTKVGPRFELADLFDWRRGHAKAQDAAASPGATASPASPPQPSGSQPLAALPPELMAKVIAVQAMLSPDERRLAFQLLKAFPKDDLPTLISHVAPMSTEQLAAFLRAQIAAPTVSPTSPSSRRVETSTSADKSPEAQ
ncbi:MAG: hypothetical protein ACTHU0_25145 [Kofleriaceae bacterium]